MNTCFQSFRRKLFNKNTVNNNLRFFTTPFYDVELHFFTEKKFSSTTKTKLKINKNSVFFLFNYI